jgi:hypothetical protein
MASKKAYGMRRVPDGLLSMANFQRIIEVTKQCQAAHPKTPKPGRAGPIIQRT